MVELGGRAQRGGRGTCDGPAGQAAAVGRRRDLRWIRAGGRREQAAAATELRPAEDKGAGYNKDKNTLRFLAHVC